MWVRFGEVFAFAPTPAVTIVYQPDGGPLKDGRHLVLRKCGLAAIAAGKAVLCERPKGWRQ